MVISHEQLLEKHQWALEVEAREENLMRRAEGVLILIRRAAFQKLCGELEPSPDETPTNLAEQITALTAAIDRTEDLRRGMRGRPTTWSTQLEELGVPPYGARELSSETPLVQAQADR
jgi:hypothetical protein